jgi:hypothetical protein
MPPYYFHLYNDMVVMDEEGRELPDMAAAREHAIEGARSLMAEQIMAGRLRLQHRIEVADEEGRVLMTIPFRELVNIEG